MPAAAPVAGLPSRLGKYELLMPLAAGGMARIYIGRSTGIGQFERHVVLKMITPERANDQVAVNMFLDEARLAASLNHQNVAQVFEVGEDHGVHYLAMEYVHGQDLRALLAKAGSQGTRIPLELALTVVAGAAAGLNHAHDRRGPDGVPLGIVHRDVSPSNIMIGYDGAVKLLDFGIAKATSRSVETQSGIIKGKFAYMAPEQCRGRDVDKRSDVFSLGIILYEISTQHRCFRADSDFDTMHRIVTGDVVRPTRLVQGYPQALEAIVMKALAVDAAQRYQSAGALLEALEAFAVANRMSLSTMGLGRFMRDMFGEVQEPWLNTAATKVMQPLAKENTISSTNGKGAPKIEAPEHLDPDDDINDGIPDEDGAFPDSGGVAMQTILDLPRGNRPETADPQQADWNAKSYPPTATPDDRNFPTNPMPMSGGGLANLHSPIGQMPLPAPQTITPPAGIQHQTLGIQPQLPLPANPLGTQPMNMVAPARADMTPVPHAFATPHSGTGPQLPPQAPPGGQPIVSTKHGYTSGAMSRGDVSHPGYAVPQDAMMGDVQLKPNRRPLFIGLGLAIVGIIVILAVSFSGKDVEKATPTPPDDQTSPTETKMQQTTPPPTTDNGASDENMVQVVVDSEPHGADVLVAGTKIGTTPLKTKLKRGTMKVDLKVHLDGYADFTTKIDLAANYENPSVKLSKADEAGSATPANGSTDGSAASTDNGSTSTSGVSSKTGQTTATGTKTTNTTGTKTTATGTKTGTGTKTNTGTGTKTNTGGNGGGTKTTTPKCQPPDHVDPFSNVPICK